MPLKQIFLRVLQFSVTGHYATNAPYTFVRHRRYIILAIESVVQYRVTGKKYKPRLDSDVVMNLKRNGV